MVFEIKHNSSVIEYAQARDFKHLIESYDEEYESDTISSISVITEEDAKSSPIRNTEYNEFDPQPDMPENFMLFDLVCGDDFCIVASTEY